MRQPKRCRSGVGARGFHHAAIVEGVAIATRGHLLVEATRSLGRRRMTDEVTYFEVAGFLADIEDQYSEIGDPIERKQQLVGRLREKWPSLSTSQAVAYVQVFRSS